MKRLKFDIRRNKDEKVKKLQTYVRDLDRLVGSESGETTGTWTNSPAAMLWIDRFRGQAQSLHRHLRQHFAACKAQDCKRHQALLRLPADRVDLPLKALVIIEQAAVGLTLSIPKAVPVNLAPARRSSVSVHSTSILQSNSNLCVSIRNGSNMVEWASPNSREEPRLRIPTDEIPVSEEELESCRDMESLLENDPLLWANKDRDLRLKTINRLATTVLTLVGTPWVEDIWASRNFVLCCHLDCPRHNQLHFSQHFARSDVQSDKVVWQTNEAQVTTLLFALGVMLVELLFCRRIRSNAQRHEIEPPDPQPGDPSECPSSYAWISRVRDRYGPHISDAVRRCLTCSFGPQPDLGHKGFREAFYAQVVAPLRNWNQPWPI